MWSSVVSFLPPAVLAVAAVFAAAGTQKRPRASLAFAEFAAMVAFLATAAAAWVFSQHGPMTSPLAGFFGFGFSARLDVVSIVMMLLVSFIGWIVVRYSVTYLDGEPRQGRFTALLCSTLACVLLVVSAGNLFQLVVAWIATSLFLHRLLLFYPDRVAAERAHGKNLSRPAWAIFHS